MEGFWVGGIEHSTWTVVRSQPAVCLCCITHHSLHNTTGSTGLRPLGFRHATTRGQRGRERSGEGDEYVCVCVSVALAFYGMTPLSPQWGVLLTFISGKRQYTQQNEEIESDTALTHTCPRPLQSFSHVCTNTHTPHNIIWITANPVFIECFQSKCQASGTPLFLCACGAACHTGSFFLSSCFFIESYDLPAGCPDPNVAPSPRLRAAQQKEIKRSTWLWWRPCNCNEINQSRGWLDLSHKQEATSRAWRLKGRNKISDGSSTMWQW